MPISENEILRADDLYHVYDTEAVDGNVVAFLWFSIRAGKSVL